MDYSLFIGALSLLVAAYQLKLDHFSGHPNREGSNDEFFALGQAIRATEYALSETVSYIKENPETRTNERIANLWENASNSLERVPGVDRFADLAFRKNLYWRNADFFIDNIANSSYDISIQNMLEQFRKLRSKHEKIQRLIRS